MGEPRAKERVLVTGAAGYVGRAVVRRLAAGGWEVLALTRKVRPENELCDGVRWVSGDLRDRGSVAALPPGCRAVVHCARSTAGTAEARSAEDVACTAGLFEACRAGRVQRLVHLSSISVYDLPAEGTLDETAARTTSSEPYANSKVRIERELLEADRIAAERGETRVVILQPGNVYGGRGGWWSGAVLEMMRRGQVMLPDYGRGMANLVHVRDLANAVCLTAEAELRVVAGECFLVIDDGATTWDEYYAALERRAGRRGVRRVSVAECRRVSARAMRRDWPTRAGRWLLRQVLGRGVTWPLSEDSIRKFSSRARFSCDKARLKLGFEAMERVEDWGRVGRSDDLSRE